MRKKINDEIEAMRDWGSLVRSGGIQRWEQEAIAEALKVTRQQWLDVLEGWEHDWSHKEPRGAHERFEVAAIRGEITRLRRLLGVKASKATVREQTRRRVQAFRDRKRGQHSERTSGHQGKKNR